MECPPDVGPALTRVAQADAARIIIAAAAASQGGVDRTRAVLSAYACDWCPDLHVEEGVPVTAVDAVTAAAALIERLVVDVSVLLHLSPSETLARCGEWVARHEPTP